MKVSIIRGGGLAGMLTATTLDSGELSPAESAQLRSTAMSALQAMTLDPADRPSGAADTFNYEITIDNADDDDSDGGHHVLSVQDPGVPAPVSALVDFVQQSPLKRRSFLPPGS